MVAQSVSHSKRYERYRTSVERYLARFVGETVPCSLYEPLKYVLDAGGKRIRPVLLMFSCAAVGGEPKRSLQAGAALEILHNFTLVHDDIMDNAFSRRGRKTVHTKWDTSVAILVGDGLLALAYRALLLTKSPHIQEIAKVFTEGVVVVCEGQSYDKEYETRPLVTVSDYVLMIEKKTAKMVSVAAEIGGLIGNGTRAEIGALRKYGYHVGLAFQIQDDLLDIMGNEKELGKKIGGDLLEGKKTFLLLEALRKARGNDKRLLKELVANKGCAPDDIPEYRRVYVDTGAIEAAQKQIETEIRKAKNELLKLRSNEGRASLGWFADKLLHRRY
jgi:geranylgeranyl diphosphate synthase type II